jgi:dTDP-glucose pyrophosphorylase
VKYRHRIGDLFVQMESKIRDAMTCINVSLGLAAIVIDESGKFLNVITDGDVRRAVLDGIDLDRSVRSLINHKNSVNNKPPVVAHESMTREQLALLLAECEVSVAPVLSINSEPVDLVCVDDFSPRIHENYHAVVMAGGLGTRLRPLTKDVPKPMLPVGDRPLLEHTIGSLRAAGIRSVNVTTHFLPEKIRDHFGDGQNFGVNINYLNEEAPLGTAGALSLIQESSAPLLVINGDVLTHVDFRALIAFHREHNAAITVGVRRYSIPVPFGIMECDGARVTNVREKPTYNFFANAGIYLIERDVCRLVPREQRFDMPDLINKAISEGEPVVSFPITEYWLDIGQHGDYVKAQEDARTGFLRS